MLHHSRAVVLGFTVVLTTFGLRAPTAFAQTATAQEQYTAAQLRERFGGAPFHYVGGDRERAGLRDAIERTIARMVFFVRPIARGRLADRNVIEDTVAFRFGPGTVTVQIGRANTTTRDDFSPLATRALTGEPLQVRQRFEGEHLVQLLTTRDGERRDEFVLAPDGRRLTMRVTVRSPRLPQPLRYQLSYAR